MNKRLVTLIAGAAFAFSPLPTTPALAQPAHTATLAPAAQLSGWVWQSDGWHYYNPSTHAQATGWAWVDGAWYHFDNSGVMQTGWVHDAGAWYWLGDGTSGATGVMQRNAWLLHDGQWYWLNADGSMHVGWLPLGGAWYFFNPSGDMRRGWLCDRGPWYWLSPDSGVMATGWVATDGNYYPFEDDGRLATIGDVRPAGDEARMASLSEAQRAVFWACDNTGFPGASLCAGWVSNVFDNAGLGGVYGNANDVVSAWCSSSNLDDLRPGMILGVESHPRTGPGSIWGHVGIYIGNGKVRDSATAGLRQVDLGSWIAWYGVTTPVRWGWANGNALG